MCFCKYAWIHHTFCASIVVFGNIHLFAYVYILCLNCFDSYCPDICSAIFVNCLYQSILFFLIMLFITGQLHWSIHLGFPWYLRCSPHQHKTGLELKVVFLIILVRRPIRIKIPSHQQSRAGRMNKLCGIHHIIGMSISNNSNLISIFKENLLSFFSFMFKQADIRF